MLREITGHKVNGCNEALTIGVHDAPGKGGACHAYTIEGFNTKTNPSCCVDRTEVCIAFQNGPPAEVGVNGITNEALLAIVADRLEGFHAGPFATMDNSDALDHVNAAIDCLHRRTKERLARGVEGTHEK